MMMMMNNYVPLLRCQLDVPQHKQQTKWETLTTYGAMSELLGRRHAVDEFDLQEKESKRI
jgi:hypothetical protein